MTRPDHRGTLAFIAVVVAGLLAGLAMTQDWTHASAAVTREGLLATFESDMRRVVYRWDAGDPRSEDTRQRALFDFVYQTYDSSAWIPQSLFDTNLVAQVVVGDVETIVRDKAGLVPWRDNRLVPAFGMAPNTGAGEPLRWTVNCLVCHTAEIDGITYFGAGTKTFDDVWLGRVAEVADRPAVAPPAAAQRHRRMRSRRKRTAS